MFFTSYDARVAEKCFSDYFRLRGSQHYQTLLVIGGIQTQDLGDQSLPPGVRQICIKCIECIFWDCKYKIEITI